MAKAASITAGLVRKKGDAVPSGAIGTPSEKSFRPTGNKEAAYYKSLTVKLDRPRYEALKRAGIELNKKSQAIFVEALDLWLSARADTD